MHNPSYAPKCHSVYHHAYGFRSIIGSSCRKCIRQIKELQSSRQIQEREDCHGRHKERKGYLPENLEGSCSVDFCSFIQVLRYRLQTAQINNGSVSQPLPYVNHTHHDKRRSLIAEPVDHKLSQTRFLKKVFNIPLYCIICPNTTETTTVQSSTGT